MGIGSTEIILILVVAFFIFGAKRLPEMGSGLGKAIRSFNKGLKGELDEKDEKSNKLDSSNKS